MLGGELGASMHMSEEEKQIHITMKNIKNGITTLLSILRLDVLLSILRLDVLFSFRFDKHIYTYILLYRPENDSK